MGNLLYHLHMHVESGDLGMVLPGPVDVELAPHTVLQPDILIMLKAGFGKLTDTHIIGPPDLVIEVSSPGTIGYERREKQDAYARGEVPEYWIVNPEAKAVEVLVLEANGYRSLSVFRKQTILPSRVVPEFAIPVEQFFKDDWIPS